MKALLVLICLANVAFGQLSVNGFRATYSGSPPYTVLVNGDSVPYLTEFCPDSLESTILLDNSGSTDGYYDPPYSVLDFAKYLTKGIANLSREYTVLAGNTVNSVIIPRTTVQNLTPVDAITSTGGTDIYNMITGTDGLFDHKTKRLFLITDGWDVPFKTQADIDLVIDTCLRYGMSFYTLLVNQFPISPGLEYAFRLIANKTGGRYVDQIDEYDSLPGIITYLASSPCRIIFPLDSCSRSWHIQVNGIDTVIENRFFDEIEYSFIYPDSVTIQACKLDTLITIRKIGESDCFKTDSSFTFRISSDTVLLGCSVGVIREPPVLIVDAPDTLTINPCTYQEFTLSASLCDTNFLQIFPYPKTAGNFPFTIHDSTVHILFKYEYTDSLSFDTSFSLVVNLCDTGAVTVPVRNLGCLPDTIAVDGAGAFSTSVSSVIIPPYSEASILFTYYPTGKDTSIYYINGIRVTFYGEGIDSTYTIKPDTIRFARSICDSTPEFYSIITVACDTTVWDGVFIPILTVGAHLDSQDGIFFLYAVTDSTRTEYFLDSCGGGYSLTIGCDTAVIYYSPVVDTIRGYISHEYLDSQRVRFFVNLLEYALSSSSDLFVFDSWRDEGIFYLGIDTVSVITITVPPKPCTVYLLEPDTIYYQFWCGERMLHDLMQERYAIFPNPTSGAFKITPEPESVEIFYDGKRVDGVRHSGVYTLVINGTTVLRLSVVL